MFGRQKLKSEIVRLQYRVEELEERLCPYGQHEWKRVSTEHCFIDDLYEALYHYKCARCGKTIKSIQPFLERSNP